ncbi:MAG: adenosylcobinamide-GDP ribazoletransferase [Halodesulfurarchaeum sp.]
MVLRAFRGAVGFLSTLPVGQTARAWEAFAARPAVMVGVGYVLGGLLLVPLLLPLPGSVAGFAFVLAVYLLAGINNADGLLDVADGVATHGSPERAREAMADSDVGVAAVLVLGLLLVGLSAVGQSLAGMGWPGLGIVVAAEVGAKLGMVAVVARGTASHEGLGSALSTNADGWTLPTGLLLATPALVVTGLHPAGAVTLAAGAGTGLAAEAWARDRLGGIGGDLLGATNEIGRLAGLLAGVIAWTLW